MKSLLYVFLALFLLTPPLLAAGDAVEMRIAEGESALYVLYEDGTVQTAGSAVFYGNPKGIQAIDFNLTPQANGYYILDTAGKLYTFGDAVRWGEPEKSTRPYVDMKLTSGGDGMYFLNQSGKISTVGNAVYYGELLKNNAVDLEPSLDNSGYYVLYDNGEIATFGSAVNRGFQTSTTLKAVDLEIVSDGYYILYSDGTIRTFGSAVNIPYSLSRGTRAVDLEMTVSGFRILDIEGQVHSILGLDNVGQITWFAALDSQPQQVDPTNTPTPTVAPTATGTPTFTPTAPEGATPTATRRPTATRTPAPGSSPTPTPQEGIQHVPIFAADFDGPNLADEQFTAQLPFGGTYTLGTALLTSIPTDTSFPGATNGTGLKVNLQPGQAIMIWNPSPIAVSDQSPLLFRVTARSSGPGAAVALAALDGSFNGSVATNQSTDSAILSTGYKRLTMLYKPPSNQVVPILQVTATGNQTVEIVFDNFEIYPVKAGTVFHASMLGADGTAP